MTPSEPAGAPWARPVGRAELRMDALIAALCLLGTAVTIPLFASGASAPVPPWPVSAAWAVLITAPLAVRRLVPSVTAAIVTVALIAGQALSVPEQLIGQIALVLALFTVGAWSSDRRRSVVVRVALVAALLVWMVVGLAAFAGDPSLLSGLPLVSAIAISVLTNAIAITVTFVFGETAWQSARRLAALQARTEELADERERTARQAVALERVRIARELHDVVAHHVSLMGVQAGAARLALPPGSERAAEALAGIEANARQAVDESHRLLHALRDDAEAAPGDAASTQGIERIDDLVAEAAATGTPTRYLVSGPPRRLPPLVGAALYRVAQEALTNVRRHAGAGARAEVRLTYGPDDVVLEVQDSGGAAPEAGGGSGFGQLGMRERLDAVGGDLAVGTTEDGYAVRAAAPAP